MGLLLPLLLLCLGVVVEGVHQLVDSAVDWDLTWNFMKLIVCYWLLIVGCMMMMVLVVMVCCCVLV